MLLIAFGSVIAAGLPLAIALVGLGISSGGLILLLANVVDVPDWTTAVSGLIGIGVGIDYALLVLTRFRAAMNRGKTTHDAIVESITTAGRSVIIAGSTVVIAVLGLFLTGLPYMYGVAISASFAVLVVMIAAVTLLPALLAYLGPRVNRLQIPFLGRTLKTEGDADSPAARWSHAVQRRPWLAAIVATAVLLALAAPALGMRLGFPDAGNDPPDTMTRQAYDLNTEGFGPGTNGPLVIAAELPDRAAASDLNRLVSRPQRARTASQFVAEAGDQRGGRRRDHHRDPDDLAAGRGDRGAGPRPARRTSSRARSRHRDHGRDRRRNRGARGPERVHHRPHAAVHRRRRRPLVPAPAGRLPLTADLAQGRRS